MNITTHLRNQVYAEISRAVNNGVDIGQATESVLRTVSQHETCTTCNLRLCSACGHLAHSVTGCFRCDCEGGSPVLQTRGKT